jgi:hypothetical protein
VWSALREQATLELSISVSRGGNNTENNIDPEAVTPGGMQPPLSPYIRAAGLPRYLISAFLLLNQWHLALGNKGLEALTLKHLVRSVFK